MSSVQQARDFVNELITVLSTEDDEIVKIQETGKLWESVNELRASQQLQIKEDIKALSCLHDDEESKILAEQADHGHRQQMNDIESEMEQAKQHKERVDQELQTTRGRLQQCQSEKEKLEEDREKVKQNTTHTLPKLRYDVNLYSNITNIRWQYDCEPGDVKGYLCNKNDVKPFALNNKQNSQFFIANYLWDLMEPDW